MEDWDDYPVEWPRLSRYELQESFAPAFPVIITFDDSFVGHMPLLLPL